MLDYILRQLCALCAIDSPSGMSARAAEYACRELESLGYIPRKTRKGGVICDLGGEGEGVMFFAHLDTLGAMVSGIKPSGRLSISPIGGLIAPNVEAENCRIYTRGGQVFGGTLQLENASAHVNPEVKDKKREFECMEVLLDENTCSAEQTRQLGIGAGDYVCFDPRTVITPSGYIKSRFLDDKLSAAILLGYAKYLKDRGRPPRRHAYLHLTVYEEVGHGASASVPADVEELLSVDMGCVGEGLSCSERQVSICAKDSGGPYDYEMVSRLIRCAQEQGLDYGVDVYPRYGSDAEAALRAGWDARHGLIGPGVYASHGYERSHKEGARNTFELIRAYLDA
jgi:putative aminopeptidase FrvX